MPAVVRAIARVLDECDARVGDLALTSLACGGDLLFAEAALARGLVLEARLPHAEAAFLRASVLYAGHEWLARYERVTRHPRTRLLFLPPDPAAPDTIYEQLNRWQFAAALAYGVERVRCVFLWNGQPGADPGGTQHMVTLARAQLPAAQLLILDSTALCARVDATG